MARQGHTVASAERCSASAMVSGQVLLYGPSSFMTCTHCTGSRTCSARIQRMWHHRDNLPGALHGQPEGPVWHRRAAWVDSSMDVAANAPLA